MPWKQYLSLGLVVLTCPCHLPLLVGGQERRLGDGLVTIGYYAHSC